MQLHRTDCEGFHRRDILRIGATGLLGLSLPQILTGSPSRRAGQGVWSGQGQEDGPIGYPSLAAGRTGHDRYVGPEAGSAGRDSR